MLGPDKLANHGYVDNRRVLKASSGILRRYVWGQGADEPLVWYEGSGTGDKRWLSADERGSIVSVSNAAGTALAVNTYDEYGIPGPNNLGRNIRTAGNRDRGLTLTRGFDANGNRTSLTHPDGTVVTYAWDGLDRMRQAVVNGSQSIAVWTYDREGRRLSMARGNGTSVGYTYDGASRLQSLAEDLAGTVGDLTTTLAYNPAGQITRRIRSNTSYVFSEAGTLSRGYSINRLNQYVAAGGVAFGYDANGNLTADGTVSYAYDIENRLTHASGGKSANLSYDPLGRLYATSGGADGVTRFLYDGDELVAEYDGAGALRRRYVHGAGDDESFSVVRVVRPKWRDIGSCGQRENADTRPDRAGDLVIECDNGIREIVSGRLVGESQHRWRDRVKKAGGPRIELRRNQIKQPGLRSHAIDLVLFATLRAQQFERKAQGVCIDK